LKIFQFKGDVISKNSLDFFEVLTIFSVIFDGSKKFTILPKISQAHEAPLTHFILLASLFQTQTQIK